MFLRTGLGACDPTSDPACLQSLDPSLFNTPLGSSAGTSATDTAATQSIDAQLNFMGLLNSIIPQQSSPAARITTPSWAYPVLFGLLGIVAFASLSSGGRRR